MAFATEPWGGAAGSRGTVVTVSLAESSMACSASSGSSGRVTDATGAVLVDSIRLGLQRPEVVIKPGEPFTIGVTWSNWCGEQPARPLALAIRLAGLSEWVVVDQFDANPVSVPPCMGENSPGNLSVTDLQPAN